MSFKILHQFIVNIDKEIEETTTRTENGKEITEKVKITKAVPHTVVLKEPSRREKQDLAMFQGVAYSEAINIGLLPRLIMTQKLSKDPSNPISGDEDRTLASMNARLGELANDYIRLNANSNSETEEFKDKKIKISIEWEALRKKVVDINTAYQSVFAHTAEQYQQNRALTWLTLFLTFVKVGDKHEPMFFGNDIKSKEEKLGDLEDNLDKLYMGALDKLATYWMLFYFGRAANSEEFAKVEAQWNKEIDAAQKIKDDNEKVNDIVSTEEEKPTP